MTRTGHLGLGSNVGDRRANLQAAVDALPAHSVTVLASSSVYDTEPVGQVLDQPEFLNAVVRISTALAPEELLDACKAVERTLGRAAGGVRHGPRPIDVDVLLLGDVAFASERLNLPHALGGTVATCGTRPPTLVLDNELNVRATLDRRCRYGIHPLSRLVD